MKIKAFGRKEAEIAVEGGDFSRLLQRCEAQGIPLRRVCFRGEILELVLPTEDLARFRRLSADCGCYGTVSRFHGGAAVLKQGYRHRIFFLTAAIALGLLLGVLALVWRCEITTEKGTSPGAKEERIVLSAIEDTGLTFPALKGKLDYDELTAAITEKCPGYAFVGVRSEGLTLKVTVVKKAKGKALPAGCKNIVAAKDGVIRSIFVLRGQQKAEVGATVSRGDLLISGTVAYGEEGQKTVFRRTVAEGKVTASVWYEGIAFVSLREIYPRETGKTAGYIEMLDGQRRTLLWGKRQNPFADSYTGERQYTVKNRQIKVVTYRETKPGEKRMTPSEALRKAETAAIAKAKAAIPAEAEVVKIRCTRLSAAAGAVGVRAVVETAEDIGMIQPEKPE